jgi:hypothetical protein
MFENKTCDDSESVTKSRIFSKAGGFFICNAFQVIHASLFLVPLFHHQTQVSHPNAMDRIVWIAVFASSSLVGLTIIVHTANVAPYGLSRTE